MENKQPIPKGQTFEEAKYRGDERQAEHLRRLMTHANGYQIDALNDWVEEQKAQAYREGLSTHEADKQEAVRAVVNHQQKLRQTLIINRSDSRCGNCGNPANPDEKRHDTRLGYGEHNGEPGCRKLWRYVTSDYVGIDDRIKEMRPDLELLSQYDIFNRLTGGGK